MRPVLVLFLLVSTTGTLLAETPPKSSESDLARAYYQAAKTNDFGEADAAFQELSKRFPNDALTKLVADHWNRRTKEEDPKNWKNIQPSKLRSLEEDSIVVAVYQIADLIVPVAPTDENHQATARNAKTFTEMISETIDHMSEKKGKQKPNYAVTYHPTTLSLVVRAPQGLQRKLEALLGQMRRQQDLQITYDVKIVSVPEEIAKTWALRELLTPKEFKKRISQAEQSERYSLTMSPRLTTFDGQIASIGTDMTHVSFHGKVSKDRRAIRLEVMLSGDGEAKIPNWIFSASETIPADHTGVFFVRSEDAASKQLDRRLLIENGIDVAPSAANQLFALITPRIIVFEEEEELLLGVVEESTTSTEASPLRPTIPAWPDYGHPYAGRSYPWPANAYDFRKQPKLEWDDGHWDLNFEEIYQSGSQPVHVWDLNMPGQSIRYRK